MTRASAALPSLIAWALGPREGQESWTLASGLVLVAMAGLAGSLLMRTWGILATAVAGVAVFSSLVLARPDFLAAAWWTDPVARMGTTPGGPIFAAILLLAAVVPFAGPIARTWRSLPR